MNDDNCSHGTQVRTDSSPSCNLTPHNSNCSTTTSSSNSNNIWPAQLYGTVYQQEFVKQRACMSLKMIGKGFVLLR